MELKGKKVLVTGSSSGIGQAVAIDCAKEGMFVVVHYRKNEEGANETLDRVFKSRLYKVIPTKIQFFHEGLYKDEPLEATRVFI
ncbi:SDR family NAD(P)-dependent oxidoreductase [candidate division WWE3 bacterium]|uniref:SDR family NAD(P)-dependent oxidoreductase n=1 Tax=candidate division WWE3 bacterium TaxID=2053526 RepID=A0A955LKR6_UNCKA|nr:SDR family NAD(P)-dependent oxidoreductase [candidate division WWE3 bacterium]